MEEESSHINDPEQLQTDYDTFANYEGIEADEDVASELQRLTSKGYLRRFDSLRDCQAFFHGEKPILSKIGVIVKNRAGKVKKRIVLDSK
eukprot:11823355-Karenia_brevis.AAC.1